MKREFIFTDKWSDIVFENRNQSYGAYMLRKRLPRNILIGYFIALLLMSTVIFTGYHFSRISIEDIRGIIDQLPPALIYEIPPALPVSPPEKKAQPASQPSKTSAQNIIPVVIDSTTDTEEKDKDLKPVIISDSKDTSGTGDIAINENPGKKNETGYSESTEPYDLIWVQKIPEFRGGDKALMKFIRSNVDYPVKYLSNDIGGTVYISFVVDSSGNVIEAKEAKGIEGFPDFTKEALHAVSKMPRWIPGQQNGKNVSVRLTLPVKFSVMKDF